MVAGLLDALLGDGSVFAAELRPPRAELDSTAGMDAWIDTYHAVRGLTRRDVGVFLTDSAVGAQEENNLRHIVTNLGSDVARGRVVPFLTTKHSLDFCLSYADQAWEHGFSSLVVLGGDKTVGRPRSVEHAWQLRHQIRLRVPQLQLGGWANPYGDAAEQARFIEDPSFTAEYFLTQIVSHLHLEPVDRFLAETERRRITHPGVYGVFYYRSANRKTLDTLGRFLPVPVDKLVAEFSAGASPIEVCARTIAAMQARGVRHFYISNLPLHGTAATLDQVLSRASELRSASVR